MYGWGDLAKPATRAECALVKGVGADGNVKLCYVRCASWSTVVSHVELVNTTERYLLITPET